MKSGRGLAAPALFLRPRSDRRAASAGAKPSIDFEAVRGSGANLRLDSFSSYARKHDKLNRILSQNGNSSVSFRKIPFPIPNCEIVSIDATNLKKVDAYSRVLMPS